MLVVFLAAGWPPSVDLSDGPRHTVRTSARPKCLEEKVIYVLGWSRRRESADTTYQRWSTIHQLKAISSDGSIISSRRRSDPKVENWKGQALFFNRRMVPWLSQFSSEAGRVVCLQFIVTDRMFNCTFQDEACVFPQGSMFEMFKLKQMTKKIFSFSPKLVYSCLSQRGYCLNSIVVAFSWSPESSLLLIVSKMHSFKLVVFIIVLTSKYSRRMDCLKKCPIIFLVVFQLFPFFQKAQGRQVEVCTVLICSVMASSYPLKSKKVSG